MAAVDEVAQTSSGAKERARNVAEASRRSVDVSNGGRGAVQSASAAMAQVKTQVDSIADRILALSEQAQAVGQIITTVNELAEQSNLLALNAAIEAARAGEHGRSFAIVAQEVRTLAEHSKRATSQVRAILGDIQKSTSNAVLATEEGNKAVSAALRTVADTGNRIEQLADVIRDAADAASQIDASSEQQARGMDQISQAMRAIGQATSQSVMGTQQSEQAAHELSALSDRMREAVAQYRY
jgi:methyl-accepting chemotaxis protein